MALTKEEKAALREKLTIKKQSNTDCWRRPGEIDGKAMQISDLDTCNVYVLDHTSQILIDRCKNTNFYLGPVKNSVFFRDCEGCTIHVPCNQFRCRDLNNSTVYLYVQTDPIIESASNLVFAPYNLAYPLLDQHIQACEMDVSENKWDLVFDFTSTDESGEKVQHHKLLDPSEFQMITKTIEGIDDEPVEAIPVPAKYGGSGRDNNHNQPKVEGETFDIRTTTAADAQKIFEEHERRKNALEEQQRQEESLQNETVEPEQNFEWNTYQEAKDNNADEAFNIEDAEEVNTGFNNIPSTFSNHDGFDAFGEDFGNSQFTPQIEEIVVDPSKDKKEKAGEFTYEEEEVMERAKNDQEERLRNLRLKEDEELRLKREK